MQIQSAPYGTLEREEGFAMENGGIGKTYIEHSTTNEAAGAGSKRWVNKFRLYFCGVAHKKGASIFTNGAKR